ncbi:NADH-quinone oxidoreductase subunit C [Streptomyces sp. ASQP_92]|nr:NADH-quinone oxidoreductase subunit C [Streptomyces sp. ASQP_92]MCT9089225.1 NADH-quinone oxidoreductase subunit C [Streptomyces sp. ASQP_92]
MAEEAYGLLTVDVPADSWIDALLVARDALGCTYFDWLSAVDEPGTGFRVCAHVVALGGGRVRRLLLRTTVAHTAAVLPSAIDVYAGAAWHERETHEMFGVDFTGHPHLVPLLLPENFEGHPLRKDFVLAARVAKAWPGAKEPGEPAAGAAHGGPKRRQMLPPGVPDPNEWGPLKGQLPPAPTRPTRTPRAAGAGAAERPARAAGDRPVRRARSVTEGSASQATPEASGTPAPPETPVVPETPATPETPAVQAAPEAPVVPEAPEVGPPAPEAPEGKAAPGAPEATGSPEASDAPAARLRRSRSASEGSASQQGGDAKAQPAAPPRSRSTDAPWHNPQPAFAEEEPGAEDAPDAGTGEAERTDSAERTDPAGGEPRE